jgi:hypothetical protein
VRANPRDARRKLDLSFGYSDLGNTLATLHRYPEAIGKFRMAESIRVEQAALDPSDLRARGALVSITWRIGRVLALSGDKHAAIETMQKGVQQAAALNRDFPGNAAARGQSLDTYRVFAIVDAILGECGESERWSSRWRAQASEWKLAIPDSPAPTCPDGDSAGR